MTTTAARLDLADTVQALAFGDPQGLRAVLMQTSDMAATVHALEAALVGCPPEAIAAALQEFRLELHARQSAAYVEAGAWARRLLDHPDATVRLRAAELLGVTLDPAAEARLAAMVLGDPDPAPEVRLAAIDTLGGIASPGSSGYRALLHAASERGDHSLWGFRRQRHALLALGTVGSPDAAPVAFQALESDEIGLRHAAAQALFDLAPCGLPAETEGVILQALVRDGNRDVRERLVAALHRVQTCERDPNAGRLLHRDRAEGVTFLAAPGAEGITR